AGRRLMTFLAARAIETNTLTGRRLRMGIVAGAAPQAVSTGSFAGTLLQLLEMAVRAHDRRFGARPHEVSRVIGQQFTGMIAVTFRVSPGNSRRPGQVALGANAVPPRWIQFRRIHDLVGRL